MINKFLCDQWDTSTGLLASENWSKWCNIPSIEKGQGLAGPV